jgi:Phage derived protein Gp49-like (DUF891)
MKLVLIGKGRWTVYAICSDEQTCPLLDFVDELDRKRGDKVLSDLREYVPWSTPEDWVKSDFSWKLRGTPNILEFRWSKKGGGTPRVFWFYDSGKVVVCSHGLNKKGDAVGTEEITGAETARNAYLQSKEKGTLEVVKLEEFDPPDKEESENG